LQVFHSRPVFSCGLFEFNWKILGIVRWVSYWESFTSDVQQRMWTLSLFD
jgi:hypothetical protein